MFCSKPAPSVENCSMSFSSQQCSTVSDDYLINMRHSLDQPTVNENEYNEVSIESEFDKDIVCPAVNGI